ncbi:hypothetical protein L226DRAFT_600066 [Lentinus tigrinus ALCF2SS1-7]|uniref:uncharacterized protein n=1 Tax=Lentinus tigrinus ALCF2SS1-7 TaxID=1328758 RepID=UPI0011660F47|nr:hypothetical protein L226DRAFT_600066 [Lentinus tigrinus ALCF2SS1-7]
MDVLAGFVSYVSGQAAYEENTRSARLQAEIAALRERLSIEAPFAITTTGAGGLQCYFAFSNPRSSASELEPSATASDFEDDSAQLGSLVSSSGSTSSSSSGVDSEESSSIVLFEGHEADQHAPGSTGLQHVVALSTSGLPHLSVSRSSSSSSVFVKRIKRSMEPVVLQSLSQVDMAIVRRLFGSRWALSLTQTPRMYGGYPSETLSSLPNECGVLVPASLFRRAHLSNVSGVVIDRPPVSGEGSTSATPLHLVPRSSIQDVRRKEEEEDPQPPGAWRVDGPVLLPLTFPLLALCVMFTLVAYQISVSPSLVLLASPSLLHR